MSDIDDESKSQATSIRIQDSLLSQAPQDLFSKADKLFEKCSNLHAEAVEWHAKADKVNHRAMRLEIIATQLQKIATDDQQALVKAFDDMFERRAHDFWLYEQKPGGADHIKSYRLSVEEGSLTMAEIEDFEKFIISAATSGRDSKSTKRKASQELENVSKAPRIVSTFEKLRSISFRNLFSPNRTKSNDDRQPRSNESQSPEQHLQHEEDSWVIEADESDEDFSVRSARPTNTHTSDSNSDGDFSQVSGEVAETNELHDFLPSDDSPYASDADSEVSSSSTESEFFPGGHQEENATQSVEQDGDQSDRVEHAVQVKEEMTAYPTTCNGGTQSKASDDSSSSSLSTGSSNDICAKVEGSADQFTMQQAGDRRFCQLPPPLIELLTSLYQQVRTDPDVARTIFQHKLQNMASTSKYRSTVRRSFMRNRISERTVVLYSGSGWKLKPKKRWTILEQYGKLDKMHFCSQKSDYPQIMVVTYQNAISCHALLSELAEDCRLRDVYIWKPVSEAGAR